MPSHFKVHELLSGAELEQLEAFAREPGRTVDECWDWLTERSFNISRGAVGNWLRELREQMLKDRTAAGGGLARAFMEATKDAGGLAVHDAAVLQVGQMIFELAVDTAAGGEVKAEDLTKMSLALQRLTLSKARLEKVREEFEERQRRAVEEASKVVQAGGDGRTVVDKVREILGIGSGGKPA